jgi:hypothetical protein
MTKKLLGVIHRWFPDRGFGFIRDAQIDYRGRVVATGHGPDHYVSADILRRSGIAPESIKEGAAVRFVVEQSRRMAGKTVAVDIELHQTSNR